MVEACYYYNHFYSVGWSLVQNRISLMINEAFLILILSQVCRVGLKSCAGHIWPPDRSWPNSGITLNGNLYLGSEHEGQCLTRQQH